MNTIPIFNLKIRLSDLTYFIIMEFIIDHRKEVIIFSWTVLNIEWIIFIVILELWIKDWKIQLYQQLASFIKFIAIIYLFSYLNSPLKLFA